MSAQFFAEPLSAIRQGGSLQKVVREVRACQSSARANMYYPGRSVRLLVVDEHRNYTDLVGEAADVWGELVDIQCQFVSSAVEALEMLQSFQPNVIMLDAHISDMNCLDFIEKCRDGIAPLVITSEHSSNSLCESVISHGASAYVPKTDDPDELEATLEKIIRIAVEGPLTH